MNKTFFKSILFVGLVACMFSCKDDNSPLDGGNTPQGVNVKFDYSQAKLGKSVGSSATLNGSSDVDWTIEVEEGDFFSVEPMSGKAKKGIEAGSQIDQLKEDIAIMTDGVDCFL